ncbi:MAG: MFS transporter [Nitrospinota bacterium]|nr:MFS transporter [Nitrospinota bacterium]
MAKKIYYGWFVLAGAFILVFMGMSARQSFGIFFKPMMEEFQLSRAALSLPASLSLILFGISQPIGGLMINRFGAKKVIAFGSIITTIGVLGMSQVSSIWGIYFFYGFLLGLGGTGNSFVALTPVLSNWFESRKGMALSIMSAGSSLGQLFLIPVFAFLVEMVTWRTALLYIGILFALTILPISFFIIKDNPSNNSKDPNDKKVNKIQKIPFPYDIPWVECLHKKPFILLTSSFFTCGFTITVITVHWIPFATDLNFAATTAALAFAVGGGLNTIGTLIVGPLSDKLGRKIPLSLVYAIRSLGFILFILYKNEYTLWATPLIIGLTWIATVPLTSALTVDFFGSKNVAILLGLIMLSHQLGAGLSAWLCGYIYDVTGSYNIAFMLAAYLCIQAAVIVCFINEKEVLQMRQQATT